MTRLEPAEAVHQTVEINRRVRGDRRCPPAPELTQPGFHARVGHLAQRDPRGTAEHLAPEEPALLRHDGRAARLLLEERHARDPGKRAERPSGLAREPGAHGRAAPGGRYDAGR